MSKTVAVKLSDALIKRYADVTNVTTLRDGRYPNLRYRFKSYGVRGSWFVVLHQNGKTRWTKIANYPQVKTRLILDNYAQMVARCSLDVEGDVVIAHWQTVSGLLHWYNKRVLDNRFLSIKRQRSVRSVIKVHLLSKLGDCGIDELNHALLDDLLFQPLVREGYELATIRLILSVLKKAYKQARLLNLLDINCVADIQFGDFTDAQVQPKGCALRSDMLPALLAPLTEVSVMDRFFVLTMLLHGSRIGETRQAKWSHFDFATANWFIPAENTKTKSEHNLPLTPLAIALLQGFKTLTKGTGYLFSGSGHNVYLSEVQANDLIQRVSGRLWNSHDLRKFARTTWVDLGTDYIIGELLLNHQMDKLGKTYIHTFAVKQMRLALADYHAWLTGQGLDVQRLTSAQGDKR